MFKFFKKKYSKEKDLESIIRGMIAPTNIGLSDPGAIVNLGMDAVPVVINIFLTPFDVSCDIAGDQAIMAHALCKFANNGSAEARNFLERIVSGEVPLYDSGGQRAFEIAQEFLTTTGKSKRQ